MEAHNPRLKIMSLQLCCNIKEPMNPIDHEAFLVLVTWRIREVTLRLQQRQLMDHMFQMYSAKDSENDKRVSLEVLRDRNQLEKLHKYDEDGLHSMRVLVWNMTSMETEFEEMVLTDMKIAYDVDVVCLINGNDPFNRLSDFWKEVGMDSVQGFRGNVAADSVHVIWDSNKIALRSNDDGETSKTFSILRKDYANWLVPKTMCV